MLSTSTILPIHRHRLKNGLWLLAEPMASAQSLAMTLMTPAGVAREPGGRQGLATLLAEMIFRGAGDRDARAHSDALDRLGVQRRASAEMHHLRLSALMVHDQLPQALGLLADMVIRPMLAADSLPASVDLALQAIESLKDEPDQQVFIELRRRHYPAPFNRSTFGDAQHLAAMTIDDVKTFHRQCCVPDGSILAFSGRFDWDALVASVEQQFGSWQGSASHIPIQQPRQGGYASIESPSTQVHIGLAYDALPANDPRNILERAAVAILSGGMSGRLFTEVREKRGLCYAVGARYGGDRDRGLVLCYSGTTAARAQETLDVLVSELQRLAQGVQVEEFERAIVRMKSELVMQGESTRARASSIAADQFLFGHPRSLDDLAQEIDQLTLDKLVAFVAEHPMPLSQTTLVTIGPKALIPPAIPGA